MKKLMAFIALCIGLAAATACPGVISSSTTLTSDYVGTESTSVCVDIAASDVVLDCAGYQISTGSATSTGVLIDQGVNNVTVKNCDIHGFTYGISRGSFGTGGGDTYQGNTIHGNKKYGIYLNSGHDNNVLTGNNLYGNGWLVRVFSTGNLIYNNEFGAATHGPVDPSGMLHISNAWQTSQQTGPNIIGGTDLGGNFWTGYTGCDNNGDGIGETAYTPTTGVTDSLPLTNVAC
jgi:parallel beta-helix repeat protein